MFLRVVALTAVVAMALPERSRSSDAGASERRGGRAHLPAEATEGPRSLKQLDRELSDLVAGQPFGRPWSEIVKKDEPPKNLRGLASVDTHRSLSRDQMEIQQQAQFLEDVGLGFRFGFVSILPLRVYRYGRLRGLQFVLERAGRGPDAEKGYREDLTTLAKSWESLLSRWGLEKTHDLTRNDLGKVGTSGGPRDNLPIRIEFEPRSAPK